ncbi:protein MON2 homolog isoform X3 [Brachypodium distachyon]|uniref:protein MON2 homolog isoform X3 n=1 Tax=Brachypodium distachyon TaxID=15368 RepID=UPI00071C793E|nr:protein MON2 homolog isoform X3 [Brachypodium distachyon]|eukprot:XP_014754709.1 protein MON2 homolog isoform X3 [Brachypodium distachyon]
MAFMAALEADLRALSAEARRRHPAVKDAAEHATLKLRSLSNPSEIAQNGDILRMFLMACSVKSVKLSAIGLSCLQKLISHDAVASSALKEILATLRDHAEMTDESLQLKTLQTMLIVFQSHLRPESEEDMSQALGICLHLLESIRSSDSVRKSLACNYGELTMRENLTDIGKLGLRLLEDLTALAAGGSARWLHAQSLHRTFALDILEFVLSTYVAVFRALLSYQQVLRHQICSLLMTSLRTNVELEGEAGEPAFRRLVLRLVAHVIRLYSSSLVTESEVFLNMLVKVTRLDLPLWHQILVLEILRGFCVEARTLRLLFQTFDMNPTNTNVVENMVKALALVVATIQVVLASDSSEETLAAVAGMFSSKAKGIEWSMDTDASNAAVLVASEAHTITLALEGLLGVVFTIATLTDEALDAGELESPRCELDHMECSGQSALLCVAMVNSTWLTILDSLSLILMRSQGEAIILEILKGYQAFTQTCGVLRAIEPLNSFLASLCKFTINNPNEGEKRSILLSPGSKKAEILMDQRDSIILTPKNVQALRTLFNVAHRLHNVLGPSWVLVLETLAALDRTIHSPHASTQEVSASVSRLSRDTSGQYSDFHILSSLNSQLFESSALMNIAAVKSLLSALHQLSIQHISGNSQLSGQQIGSIAFSVERMTSILVNNLHRVEPIWDQIAAHHLELANCSNLQLRNMALDSLDHSICSVVGSEKFEGISSAPHQLKDYQLVQESATGSFEYAVLSPLVVLYSSNKNIDVQMGALKILLHVLERHGEKLSYSWPGILHMLRAVTDASEKDIISLGFQSIRVIMNEGLATIPVQCLDECILVTGAYGAQKTDINISLTAVGLLWTATDFVVKGLIGKSVEKANHMNEEVQSGASGEGDIPSSERHIKQNPLKQVDYNKLFFSVFSVLQKLGADDRPEVRNSAVRTLFQTLCTHGQKLSKSMWEDCLWIYVFPMLERVTHLASTSSRDEWQGKELGTRAGKAVHMLIHHSRNTAQKQWDETIVLLLGGIARLLRSFFPLLQQLSKFSSGWALLLAFVKNSILNGSKEVALAAINCLQTFVGSNCPKGNLESSYVKSVLDIYELVLQTSPNYKSDSADKVKQEVLRGLGDLYVQAQSLFDDAMYLRLMAVMHLMIKSSMNSTDSDSELGSIPAVQRGILEIIPMLRPTTILSSMWPPLLLELLCYFNGHESPLHRNSKEIRGQNSDTLVNGTKNASVERGHISGSGTKGDNMVGCGWGILFIEKLVPIMVNLFLEAPPNERCSASPEIIQALGRCMNTRRDNPRGTLWRISAECFNRVVTDEVKQEMDECKSDMNSYRLSRARFWKEVADLYETFLVGSCGRVLSSDVPSADSVTADESLEMTVLTVCGDSVLKLQKDAPVEILQRLVNCLDRCASRTGSLPIQTIGLLPLHCSRFSLGCLQMLFSLCSCPLKTSLCSPVSETSKVSISILTKRCEVILGQFLADENDLGERALPSVRIEETICVLQELARLIINIETANSLSIPLYLKEALGGNKSHGRAHLLSLLPTFSELVVSREARVRELVQVLLRLISSELGLQRLT